MQGFQIHQGLIPLEGIFFLPTALHQARHRQAGPGDAGFGTIAQGFLEASNVNIAEELVNMIIGQRAYEINSKAIQTADEMMRTANEVKR